MGTYDFELDASQKEKLKNTSSKSNLDEKQKMNLIKFSTDMSIFNKKEFHLLFTVMSEKKHFRLLIEKVFANNKDFFLMLLNSFFVDLPVEMMLNRYRIQNIKKNVKEEEEDKLSIFLRDNKFYKYYYELCKRF